MSPTTFTLSARYIFPVDGPPIANGLLKIRDGKIVSISSSKGSWGDVPLGNVAITPGFVNAHTHLELSAIEEPQSPSPKAENEVEWLKRVIRQRRAGGVDQLRAAVLKNLAESLDCGTTSIADTTTAGLSWPALSEAPIRSLVFAEVIGLKRERAIQTNEEAWNWISGIKPEPRKDSKARAGLSPHAPYSTAGWVYQRAAFCKLPLSTHIAEMPEELELLRNRSGPLRQFLEELGAWDDDWDPIGPSPADYIRKGDLRNAEWLVAHGTYLQPSEFWQFQPAAATKGQRVAVVYCPRTHARFGHATHPFREMLERGIIVCLGTDSLASSPTLGILDEMRFLHRQHDAIPGALLLAMGTLFGAWALRSESTTGSLEVGKSADLALIALPDREAEDPYQLLLESDLPVVGTVFQGTFVSGRWVGV